MEQQSTKLIIQDSNLIDGRDAEFHDALKHFPFVDASSYFESGQPFSSSEHDRSNDEDDTVCMLSEHTPESPSSPSSAGLRQRRLVSQRSYKESSQSQFFINNPDGLIDFNPPGKKYERSCSLKDNKKLNENLNSTTVHLSSSTYGNSVITSADGDERIDDVSNTVNSPNPGPNLLISLTELLIEALRFQTKFLISPVTFPIWLLHSSYMLMTDPFSIIRYGTNYMPGNVSGIWGICYNSVKLIKKHESTWKLCFRLGRGLLWLAFCGFILTSLLVAAFLVSSMIMKLILEEPVQIIEQLTFDYTKDTPMAFVPIISCEESSSLEHSIKSKVRVIPFDRELQATISLTLPESDYNRNLGIFQVRVDFLSSDGKPLATTRQPCMLQFKSATIRLISTFLKLAPLLSGYSSETQTLDIKFNGYIEKDIPTSCSRVVIEQRAEFTRGGGVPEIYTASLKLESQLPFLKRILWYWKGVIYLWISIMMFWMELAFILLFCAAFIVIPWLLRGSVSSNSNEFLST